MAKAQPSTFEQEYKRLNGAQRQAVDTIEGPVMVLAGPGSGKTQVLTVRIANILQSTQMDPWNILCLTFTESGTANMRQRLYTIIGRAAYYVRIYTFHSFCNEIIQENQAKFALARDWQALSEIEQVEIVRDLIDQLPATSALKPFGDPYLYLSDVIQNIGRLKQENITPEKYETTLNNIEHYAREISPFMEQFFEVAAHARRDDHCQLVRDKLAETQHKLNLPAALILPIQQSYQRYEGAVAEADSTRQQSAVRTKFKNDLKRWLDKLRSRLPKQQALADVYRAYQAALRTRGRYDFGDMILQVVAALQKDDELLARYQEQFQYILVDEYQDTNSAQNEVLKLLGSFDEAPNIFVVGDDKQSIYRFQGASLENLLFFYELYTPKVKIISLTKSYRAHQLLLSSALAVIKHNEERINKYIPQVAAELESAQGGGKQWPIEVREYDSTETESYGVAQLIENLISQGVDPDQIAVLYRYHRDGEELKNMLLRLNVPLRVEAGDNVLRDLAIEQFITLLRYIADSSQTKLLADIIEHKVWGFEALATMRILHYAGSRRLSVFEVISQQALLQEAGVDQSDRWLVLANNLARWRQLNQNSPLEYTLDTILQESGWLKLVVEQQEHLSILPKLRRLFEEGQLLNRRQPNVKLQDFIRHVDLLQSHQLPLPIQAWQTRGRAVHLMTAHKAKGLEFSHVFLINLHDKHWGNIRERSRLPLPPGLIERDMVLGQENNEDERRLFFVALTRAKQRVYLSYSTHNREGRQQLPSLFLAEIPTEYLKRVAVQETDDEARQRLQTLAFLPSAFTQGIKVREWLSERVAQYALSATHLQNYLTCPRLFYYHNLLQVPIMKSKHLSFGTAVHYALRDFFLTYRQAKQLPTLSYLLDRFQVYLGREAMKPAERRDSQHIGEKALTAYYHHYIDSFPTEVWVEYNFKNHGVHLETVPLTGQLDKIEVIDTARRRVNVVDYKTGSPDGARGRWQRGGEYWRQVVFYKLLCDLSPRFTYTMVSGEIDFIQPSARTGKFMKPKIKIEQSDLEEVKQEIKQVYHDIQELKFLDPSTACGECEYCLRGY